MRKFFFSHFLYCLLAFVLSNAALAAGPATNSAATPPPAIPQTIVSSPVTNNAPLPAHGLDYAAENQRQRRYLTGLMIGLVVVAAWYLRSRKR